MAVNTCFNQSFGFNIQNLDIISLKYYGRLNYKMWDSSYSVLLAFLPYSQAIRRIYSGYF